MRFSPVLSMLFVLFQLPYQTAAETPSRASLSAHGEFTIDASLLTDASAPFDSSLRNAGRTMLTLNVKTTGIKNAKVECLVDFFKFYGLYQELAATAYNDSFLVNTTGEVPFLTDLRMLYGALYLPWADITIGRQVVNFGKGMLFSPLDCFSTIDVTELAFRRSGSDIAMAAIPLGTLSGVDIITSLPQGGEQTSALRAFTTVHGWDLSASAIYRSQSEHLTGGISFKGDYHAGLTGELVARYDNRSGDLDGEAMAGIDYSLQQTWFMNGEYFYRTASSPHLLYRTHNLFGSVRFVINDLMNVSLSGITTLPLKNRLITLQFAWNILQSVNTVTFLRHAVYDNTLPLPDTEAGLRITIAF